MFHSIIFKKFQFRITLLCFLITASIDAQVLNDTYCITIIKSGIDNIYNLQFDEAHKVYKEISDLYPGHPVSYLYHAIMTYWENYPLLPNSGASENFENDLRQCMNLCENEPYNVEYRAESLLANICARGLLLLFYSDNDLSMNVIPLATGTYRYIMDTFNYVSYYNDFNYFTGIYNYYREAYPRFHPVYKPLVAIFPPGDLLMGLNQLGKSAEDAIFLKAESNLILTWIYASFENNYPKALFFSNRLTELYPKNLMFRALHVRNLLLLKEYDKAENILGLTDNGSGNTFYDAQADIFRGILSEKKYSDPEIARKYYEKGIKSISAFGDYGNEFCGYGYLGLSRICDSQGDKTGRKAFRRKGNDLVDFKKMTFD